MVLLPDGSYKIGPTKSAEIKETPTMGRGLLVFLAILLLGGGFFWALVGGCVAS
jgi:hypothetical protein